MTTELWLGLGTGIIFGILLQQGRVARYEKQVGAMLFRDMTIFKFMLTAIMVGMVGLHLLAQYEVISLSIKGTVLGANIIGGILFGMGWAVMGYCPGTSLAALAEGRFHAIWAILGMLVGAAAYAETYPSLKENILTWGDYGKITLPGILEVSPWLVIAGFIVGFLGLFAIFEKKGV
ncbi:MAG: YeeE/YedE family protein [Planctomycetes bacterium]|nr:YeeE/YedE family protein [Planctomycetota bacterium]